MKKRLIIILAIVAMFCIPTSFVINSVKAEEPVVQDIKYSLVSDDVKVNPNNAEGSFVSLIKESSTNAFVKQYNPNFVMRSNDMKVNDAVVASFDEIEAKNYQKIAIQFFATNWSDIDYTIGIYKSGEQDLSVENIKRTVTIANNDSKEVYLEYSISDFADINGKIKNLTFVITSDNGLTDNQIWFNYISFFNVKEEKVSKIVDLQVVGFHPISSKKELFIQVDNSTGFIMDGWDGTPGGNYCRFPNGGKELLDSLYLNDKTMSECGVETMTGGKTDLLWFGGNFNSGDVVTIKANAKIDDGEKGFRFINESYFTFNGTSWSMSVVKMSRVKIASIEGSTDKQLVLKLNKVPGISMLSNGELSKQIKKNGKAVYEIGGSVGFKDGDTLTVNGLSFENGDIITVPQNTVYAEDGLGFNIISKYVISYDGSSFSMEEFSSGDVEEYKMEEGVLSDCTDKSLQPLIDGAYDAVQIEYDLDPIGWHTNSKSDFLTSSFVDNANSPEGADGGTYYFGWKTEMGLLFPSTIFKFTQKVEYDISDDLVLKIYIKSDINDDGNILITNASAAELGNTIKSIPISTLKKGSWTTLHLRAKDLIDPNGELKYLAFTVMYPSSYLYSEVKGSGIYFDTFYFESVERVVQETYTTVDISEVIPMGINGLSITGSGSGNKDDFDYESYSNVGFIRTDSNASAVSFKLSLNEVKDADFYFVMLGTDLYYQKGGIYFWFTENGVGVGTGTTKQTLVTIENFLENNKEIDIEIGTIPYYVNMVRSGYYAFVKVNGEQVVGEFYDMGETSFGQYFGLYLSTTSSKTTVTVKPETLYSGDVVSVTLQSQIKDTNIEVGDIVRLIGKVKGKFYGQSNVEYEIIEGNDCATIDGDGYLEAVKSGKVVVKAKVVNTIGTFESETLEFVVLGAENTDNEGGCNGSIGTTGLSLVMLTIAWLIIKKKIKKEGIQK